MQKYPAICIQKDKMAHNRGPVVVKSVGYAGSNARESTIPHRQLSYTVRNSAVEIVERYAWR